MNRSKLLNSLWRHQTKKGYISDEDISELSAQFNISNVSIEGVASFYHFFHRQPTGQHIVYLNNSIVSELKGFAEIKAAFEKETGESFGKPSKDGLFSLFETSCIGLSDQEPAALIDFYPFNRLIARKGQKNC